MRRLCVTLMLSTFLPLLAPVRADAFWRWLDDMSGPGNFHGVDGEVRLWCFGETPKHGEYDMTALTTRRGSNLKPPDLAAVSGCLIKKLSLRDRRKATISVIGGYQVAHYTHLVYDTEKDRSVYVISLRAAGWWRLHRTFEIGVNAGLYTFDTTETRIFGKFGIEPQVDIKPIALFRDLAKKPRIGAPDSQYDQMLSLRLGFLMFPGGFDAKKFGAQAFRDPNGTFSQRIGAERIFTMALFVDLEPAFRLRKAAQ
jgi:hypothetical protein